MVNLSYNLPYSPDRSMIFMRSRFPASPFSRVSNLRSLAGLGALRADVGAGASARAYARLLDSRLRGNDVGGRRRCSREEQQPHYPSASNFSMTNSR